MVVLARVIVDVDQVSLSAKGVTTLVHILKSKDDHAVILAGRSPSWALVLHIYCCNIASLDGSTIKRLRLSTITKTV